ncbi:hypothetical protein O6H91_06G045900 [Diphasiastrum complanatum]|uniref:Uncharacterized protein n=2 Tax=Diphasiastrum complanatum TaxID=34168 RepID=A0ACC2DDK4_DIPCM|nr:hypothetical protein O6H91_06G045900 [Diphasiastrum complanatum]KAJ7552205.1 hypothetical protein O6H91_06G045900 [Diphasiastrum complanatum]
MAMAALTHPNPFHECLEVYGLLRAESNIITSFSIRRRSSHCHGRFVRVAELRSAKSLLLCCWSKEHNSNNNRVDKTWKVASFKGCAAMQQSEAFDSHEEKAEYADCEDLCTSPMGLCDTVVGVLGGGQLGRMLCQAASPMGIKVAILDPAKDCPASAIAYQHVVGSFRDMNAVRDFAKGEGGDVQPKPFTIRIIQDKYLQKVHFSQHSVPLSDFMQIDNVESLEKASHLFGFPLMIKSRCLAYDGRGNAVARCQGDLMAAVNALGGFERGLYAEKWAPFVKELAVMVARGRDSRLHSFPVVETIQRENICHLVEAPAQVSVEVATRAVRIAEQAVGSLDGAGVFGVELFLLVDGQVLLNEVAPRPHNSGHYSIEACITSQFEQHLRAVLGLPLGETSMKVPAAVMYNVLGEDEGTAGFSAAQKILRRAVSIPGASVHWYEKPDIRKHRKMGHITVVGSTMEVARARMNEILSFSGQITSICSKAETHIKAYQSAVSDHVEKQEESPLIGIIMGSDSDLPVMKAAAEVLDSFGVSYEVTVVSAHRTPLRMVDYAQKAQQRGIKVIIAGAGGAAHLPGMVAALTPLPVIGVPVKASALDGVDSLLSIVQMPKGVPVAVVAIQNATNAGLLALRMLGATDRGILEKIAAYQEDLRKMVTEKAEKLESVGWRQYLNL